MSEPPQIRVTDEMLHDSPDLMAQIHRRQTDALIASERAALEAVSTAEVAWIAFPPTPSDDPTDWAPYWSRLTDVVTDANQREAIVAEWLANHSVGYVHEDEAGDFPSLADVLADHQPDEGGACAECGWSWLEDGSSYTHIQWGAHQAAAWLRACRIDTVEQLDALPTYALIRDIEDGTLWERNGIRWVWLIGPFHARERKPLEHDSALLIWSPEWETP